MAPSPGDIYKSYFDEPTLSDLTIRLRDRTIHVHRIVLCRRSAYFGKLILGGFREAKFDEIELHGDDPDAMMALFRCIYGLPCDEPSKLKTLSTTMKFLAKICVVAEKYQLEDVQVKVAEQMEKTLWDKTENDMDMNFSGGRAVHDFLAATKIVFDGTSKQDNACRVALVNFCVFCIVDLEKLPEFSKLLCECDDLAVAINAHENLSIVREGFWFSVVDSTTIRQAVPRCPKCMDMFPTWYIRAHRDEAEWTCCDFTCGEIATPVCSECNKVCPEQIAWEWKEESDQGQA